MLIKVANEVQTEPSAITRMMSYRKYHACVSGKASGKKVKTGLFGTSKYSTSFELMHLIFIFSNLIGLLVTADSLRAQISVVTANGLLLPTENEKKKP